jgi:hypothetical protein
VPIILKYGNLNLLEPSGPFQACNGIALRYFYRHKIPERTLEFCSLILLTETRRNDDNDENDEGSDDDDDDDDDDDGTHEGAKFGDTRAAAVANKSFSFTVFKTSFNYMYKHRPLFIYWRVEWV